MEQPNFSEHYTDALEGLKEDVKGGVQHFQTGGYVNTTPMGDNSFYPQSRITSAQPYAAAGNTGVVNTIANGASFAEGGLLVGDGDGMSDNIDANIDGQEPVRLADGEFVVPPHIVSMIGNGDHAAGSKLLDQLLPMVRKASYGTDKQVRQDAGKKVVEKLVSKPEQKAGSLAAEKMAKRKARG
jgi:hypothetical protein